MLRRHLLKSGLLVTASATLGSVAVIPALGQFSRSAPEFIGIEGWMNAAAPVTIAGLRGKVVLVNFWTYSCINCRRPMQYLKRWQSEYGPSGLQVIGIHCPEFGFEHDRSNVAAYVREIGIPYPVGQDNGFQTWNAWSNEAWPGFYLVDRSGKIVLVRLGEDNAHEIETAIRGLLGLNGPAAAHPGDDPDLTRIGTSETYFGSAHPTPQDRGQSPRPGKATYSFTQATKLRLGEYALDGVWSRYDEPLSLVSPRGSLRFRFSAAKLHMVASAPAASQVRVRVDGGEPKTLAVGWPTLYTLVDGGTYGEHIMEVESDSPGLAFYCATFG
jgi:thiol-disulfide isomerase/thioredoxin